MKKKIALFLTLVLISSALCTVSASAVAPGQTGIFFTASDIKTVYCPNCGQFMGYAQVTTSTTYENGKAVSTCTLTVSPMRCHHCGYFNGGCTTLVEQFNIPGSKLG